MKVAWLNLNTNFTAQLEILENNFGINIWGVATEEELWMSVQQSTNSSWKTKQVDLELQVAMDG